MVARELAWLLGTECATCSCPIWILGMRIDQGQIQDISGGGGRK